MPVCQTVGGPGERPALATNPSEASTLQSCLRSARDLSLVWERSPRAQAIVTPKAESCSRRSDSSILRA